MPEMVGQVRPSNSAQVLPPPGRAGLYCCLSPQLSDALSIEAAIPTVTISGVKIMGIFHWVIKSPPLAECLKQVEILLGFLRSLGGSLREKVHGFEP